MRDHHEGLAQEAVLEIRELLEKSSLQLLLLALAVEHAHRGLGLFDRDAGLEAAEEIEPGVALVVQRIPGGRDGGLHHDRHPHVGGDPGVGPFESWVGNANYRKRVSVEPDGRSDQVSLSGEARLPEVVLKDGDGMGVADSVVFRAEEAAEMRSDAEDVEVVAGYETDADHLAAVFADQARRLD